MNSQTHKLRHIAVALLATASMQVMAQGTIVKGNVTDGTEPIIGATVKVNGSTVATITDLDGNFVLKH